MHNSLKGMEYELADLASWQNINEHLTKEQSRAIGEICKNGYTQDRSSRRQWEINNRKAMELALQVVKDKTFPFKDASNVKHPLITIATLQWSSRAYAALIRPPSIVRCRVTGKDPDGKKASRAGRVAEHMNYQLTEDDEAWEAEHDALFMTIPIVGCSFTKTTKHQTQSYPVSKHVLASDLVMDYHAKSVESCNRKTHRFMLWDREIRERVAAEEYTDNELGAAVKEPEYYDEATKAADIRQGITDAGEDTPRLTLEQHCYFDFDGDGYDEPYIVTFDFSSGKVHRITNRFRTTHTVQSVKATALQARLAKEEDAQKQDVLQRALVMLRQEKPEVLRIEAAEYFTKYSFIPAPDGGIYDLGFGTLLGPLNRAVDSIINELIDAGKLQNQSSGFVAKGAKLPGGSINLGFGEWLPVDVAGSTLKDSFVPLPVNPPSETLFNLLGLLISYAEKTASVTDAMTGQNPGQNTPAYGWQQMLTQGMAVYSGIFKRQWRAMRAEFRLRYIINALYLNPVEYFSVVDEEKRIAKDDYAGDPKDVRPVADPNTVLVEEKLQRAMMVAERAKIVDGYDHVKVERMLLEAMQMEEVHELFPLNEDGTLAKPAGPPPDFKLAIMEEQRKGLEFKEKHQLAKAEAGMEAKKLEAEVEKIEAETIKIYAEAGAIESDEVIRKAAESTKRLEVQRKGIKDIGDLLMQKEQIDAGERSDRRMATQSGNGSAAGSSDGA